MPFRCKLLLKDGTVCNKILCDVGQHYLKHDKTKKEYLELVPEAKTYQNYFMVSHKKEEVVK